MKKIFIILPLAIFLIGLGAMMYFLTTDIDSFGDFMNSDTGSTIFIAGFVVLFALIMGGAFAPSIASAMRNTKVKKMLRERGTKTMATVLAVRDTGVTVNNNPYIEVIVETTKGNQATFKMLLSRIQIIRPGDKIEVIYDPADPTTAVAA